MGKFQERVKELWDERRALVAAGYFRGMKQRDITWEMIEAAKGGREVILPCKEEVGRVESVSRETQVKKVEEPAVVVDEEGEEGDVEARFGAVYDRVLKELEKRTSGKHLEKMPLEELSGLIKTCRENLAAIGQAKVRDSSSAMEVVTVLDFEEKAKAQ